jgi:Transport protein particle (TRAPP) component
VPKPSAGNILGTLADGFHPKGGSPGRGVSISIANSVATNADWCQSLEVSADRIPSTTTLTASRTRVDKVNAELVTLTYGTIVAQLCADYEYDYAQVNQQLDKMGYNIGMRLIEDFLAKSNAARCGNFRETADMISRVSYSLPKMTQANGTVRLGSRCF